MGAFQEHSSTVVVDDDEEQEEEQQFVVAVIDALIPDETMNTHYSVCATLPHHVAHWKLLFDDGSGYYGNKNVASSKYQIRWSNSTF